MKRLRVDQSASSSLAPRPDSNSIARVLVLRSDDDEALVLDIDALEKTPKILDQIDKGYAGALRFWNWAGAAVFWVGISASFLWHWWAFIPGTLLAIFLWRMNRKSVVQFAAGAFAENPFEAELVFNQHGLLWRVEAKRLQRDTTLT